MTQAPVNYKSGFTLMEALIASSITGMIITAVLTAYLWCGKISRKCEDAGWAQKTAQTTANKIKTYIYSASGISSIDTNGNWVALSYPDGQVGTLVFTNSPEQANSGAFAHISDAGALTWITRSGITNNMKLAGIGADFFALAQYSTNQVQHTLQVQFQTSKPTGNTALSEEKRQQSALNITMTARLRNYEP